MAKILIVDDSKVPRLLLRRLLEPEGHIVREAEDGASALTRYREERPDVVFLDLVLREESGFDVLASLRALDVSAAVILATGDAEAETRSRAGAEGARGFVTKPFGRDEVLGLLLDVLRPVAA